MLLVDTGYISGHCLLRKQCQHAAQQVQSPPTPADMGNCRCPGAPDPGQRMVKAWSQKHSSFTDCKRGGGVPAILHFKADMTPDTLECLCCVLYLCSILCNTLPQTTCL
jgi:hypothetical protein